MKQIILKDGSYLQIKVGWSYCYLPVFIINYTNADACDFGHQEDIAPEIAEPYCCGNMQFIPKESTLEVLNKYGITEAEYEQICEELDCLSFGACGWCE